MEQNFANDGLLQQINDDGALPQTQDTRFLLQQINAGDDAQTQDTRFSLQQRSDDNGLTQDTRLICSEIQTLRDIRRKCFHKTTHLQNGLHEQQKIDQKQKATKANLEREVAEFKRHLENEGYYKFLADKQSGKTRKLFKDIADSLVQNNQTLEFSMKLKQDVVQKLEKQNTEINENLIKMEEILKNKECEVRILKETNERELEIYRDDNKKRDDEILIMKEQLNNSEREVDVLSKEFDELNGNNVIISNKMVEMEKENMLAESELQKTQKQKNDILSNMEQQQRQFEDCNEEISRDLYDISYEMQKCENEVQNLERAVKNQNNYNLKLDEEIKSLELRCADFQQQNEQLEQLNNEKTIEFMKNEKQLQDMIADKLAEAKNIEFSCVEEQKIVTESAEAMAISTKRNEELINQLEQYEAEIRDLQAKQEMVSQNVLTLQEDITILISKQTDVDEELKMWKEKNKICELEKAETLACKEAELNELDKDTKMMKIEIEDLTKANFQEMHLIKIDFDLKITQDASQYQEQEKEIENNIEYIEKENQTILECEMSQDEELKNLNEECDLIKTKIKNLESLNNILANFAVIEKQVDTSSVAAHPQLSQMPFIPPLPKRERVLDEMSGSSAEGQNSNYLQFEHFRREKQHRQKLREQRKLLKAKRLNAPK